MFTNINKSIDNKRLLIFWTTYVLCLFNVITTKTLRILSFFSLTEILICSRKKGCDRNDWQNHDCDGYSNLPALYITMSADAFIISINSDNTISFQNVLCHWNLVYKKSLYATCENGRCKKWLTKMFVVDHKGFNSKNKYHV